ncbi:hypothetical protein K504DRAFT_503319 [Pleomassaria siparia CBS 279.74]|uniref:Uncharacterized protein n=1 Tax=Pleomassaria siparia CBS 279.74 TaxID=1314801 RepID=A0A6G1K677_9PLEO|nr:hypothetical protein K504DRAFT_503319 [Pleomassaria siparia CBS 279.74]
MHPPATPLARPAKDDTLRYHAAGYADNTLELILSFRSFIRLPDDMVYWARRYRPLVGGSMPPVPSSAGTASSPTPQRSLSNNLTRTSDHLHLAAPAYADYGELAMSTGLDLLLSASAVVHLRVVRIRDSCTRDSGKLHIVILKCEHNSIAYPDFVIQTGLGTDLDSPTEDEYHYIKVTSLRLEPTIIPMTN